LILIFNHEKEVKTETNLEFWDFGKFGFDFVLFVPNLCLKLIDKSSGRNLGFLAKKKEFRPVTGGGAATGICN
jgi:hypothetical protein